MPRPNRTGKVRPHLRDWLKAERRTQDWLAEQVGDVHQTTVSLWLRGGEIPLEKALRLAHITGLSVEDIGIVASDADAPASTPALPDADDHDDVA
jgi:hypothetical protein